MTKNILDRFNIPKVSLFVENASISNMLENGGTEHLVLVSTFEFVKNADLLIEFYLSNLQFFSGVFCIWYKHLIILEGLIKFSFICRLAKLT